MRVVFVPGKILLMVITFSGWTRQGHSYSKLLRFRLIECECECTDDYSNRADDQPVTQIFCGQLRSVTDLTTCDESDYEYEQERKGE